MLQTSDMNSIDNTGIKPGIKDSLDENILVRPLKKFGGNNRIIMWKN